MKLLITSGYNNSLHSLALLNLLKRKGVHIEGVLIVRLMSIKRFQFYYQQMGMAELLKKFKDRILSNSLPLAESEETAFIIDYIKKQGIARISVSEFCINHKIPYQFVKSLNSKKAIAFTQNFDLALYTGGGILGKKFLSNFRIGVLNCHAAKLPEIRGMNSSEWSVLLNIPLQNTLHFMVRKIDMGPLLFWRLHDYSDCKSISSLRGKAIIYTIEDLVWALSRIKSGKIKLTHQMESQGLQYFTMHRIIRSIVNAKLLS